MLSKNQDITVTVESLTNEGSGVGHYDGQAVFIGGSAPGDTVKCHIIKAKKTYAVGKLTEIVTPSADRIKPDCPVFGRCGGCAYRHISYDAECIIKQKNIADSFERIGKLSVPVNKIISAPSRSFYRNKAQYPVRRENGTLKIGFFAPFSHRVIDCRDCLLQPTEFGVILSVFSDWIEKYNIPVYDETTHTGLIRHIYLRKAFATGEIMVCAVINGQAVPHKDELITALLKNTDAITGVCLNINTQRTNVILGEKCVCLWGREYIEDILCGVRVRISPLAFYQVNRAQAQTLYEKAAEYAALTPDTVLLDLYCGAGTIGLSMAERVKQIIGVEIIPQAIENAKINAEINGINNARFICADAAQAAAMLKNEDLKPDVVILDPPRKGCDSQLIETVAAMQPDRIVYVSCDHATLARDCAAFAPLGYKTVEATPVDLFPSTTHVETVVLLSHKKPDGHINVKVEFGEGEGKVPLDDIAQRAESYKPKERVTYKMIKEYIEVKYGFKVHTAYIAEVKRDLGLPMYDAPNAVEKLKQPRKHPTAEKVEAIKDALKHFEVI